MTSHHTDSGSLEYSTSTSNVRPGIVNIGALKKYTLNFSASIVADVTISFRSLRFCACIHTYIHVNIHTDIQVQLFDMKILGFITKKYQSAKAVV